MRCCILEGAGTNLCVRCLTDSTYAKLRGWLWTLNEVYKRQERHYKFLQRFCSALVCDSSFERMTQWSFTTWAIARREEGTGGMRVRWLLQVRFGCHCCRRKSEYEKLQQQRNGETSVYGMLQNSCEPSFTWQIISANAISAWMDPPLVNAMQVPKASAAPCRRS